MTLHRPEAYDYYGQLVDHLGGGLQAVADGFLDDAAVGAGALSQGLTFDKVYAEQLATQGVTAEQAREGYAQIGAELPELSKLGSIYGEEFNQRTAEQGQHGRCPFSFCADVSRLTHITFRHRAISL